jgi:hypothetical protein
MLLVVSMPLSAEIVARRELTNDLEIEASDYLNLKNSGFI